ncbi:hypothetical protein DSM107007_31600 [Nostoc sp. PCC 7120 = FACHB-418]|nr:hypothetical protein DSM107007_31600 [Nostoc sp. PCC 7120 = FACHB-418]
MGVISFPAMAYTNKAANKPPVNATNKGDQANISGAKMVVAVTAKYAPAFTPNVAGEARGLRVTVWNNAPAIPRDAPANIPMVVRGSLM